MSEAAIRLRNSDDRLLNIALDAGYDSHEVFARAFKDMFGAPPSTIHANPDLISRLQEPITMTSEQQPTPEPRIVHRPAQKIVGVSEAYTKETRVRIPAQWERAVEEFGPKMCGGETFGVCYGFDGVSFRYLAGVTADRSGGVDWPDHVELPAARYAVFGHSGHISHIPDTWTAIFESWAPTSGLQIAEAPQFELYSEDFDPSGSGRVSIWIPVEGD